MQPRFTAALDAVAPTFNIQVGKAPIGRRNATRIGFGPGLDGIRPGPRPVHSAAPTATRSTSTEGETMPVSKFRTMTTSLAMAAGLTLAALTAPVASAAPSTGSATGYDRCASPNFCLFENIDGQGRVIGLQGQRGTLPLDFDNITSSIRNRSGQIWSVYTGTNFTGRCLPVSATYTGNVTQYSLNDQISSARPGPCPA